MGLLQVARSVRVGVLTLCVPVACGMHDWLQDPAVGRGLRGFGGVSMACGACTHLVYSSLCALASVVYLYMYIL